MLKLADDVEERIQGGLSSRPVFAVPHILADESSCYYHGIRCSLFISLGYVLAEMSVHQTRGYFEEKYGSLVDVGGIGEDLARVYWNPGNSKSFLDLVMEMTGKPLAADAW